MTDDRLHARRTSLRLWALNIVAGCGIGVSWLRHVPEGAAVTTWIFALLALVSVVSTVSLVPGLALLALARLPWPRVVASAHVLAWSAFLTLAFLDARTYDLFRFHLNGTVLHLLLAPDPGHAVPMGARQLAPLVIVALLALGLEAAAWRVLRRRPAPAPSPRRVRPAVAAVAVLFAVFAAEKILHAHADMTANLEITATARVLPAYYRFTVRGASKRWLGKDAAEPRVPDRPIGLGLKHPLRPVELGADPPSVLLIVIDSLRADMLAPETMPRVLAHSAAGRRFDDHVAGGNTTRFGVFSLLYGIHGSYWDAALAERHPAPLVEAWRRRDAVMGIFASASLRSPEFTSTAFAGVASVEDRLRDLSPRARDDELHARLVAFIRARAADRRPFFAFALLDATHQVYSHPEDAAPFQPEASDIDYLEMSRGLDEEEGLRLFNRYRNAVRYADAIAGEVLDAIREGGLEEETLIVVTGDHGEEMGEHGAWGHNSHFCPEQVRVPFVLWGPGVPPGAEARPTCHVDVAPTLLELAGVPASSRRDHALGESLLDPPVSRERAFAGWERLAIWTDDGVIVLPLAGHLGIPEVVDLAARRLPHGRSVLSRRRDAIERLARENRAYLR